MREYAHRQTSKLLRRLADAANRAAKTGNAEAIHDLRVALRRMNACLRLFSQFYPQHARKHLRKKLRALMQAAGAVRDRDIGMALVADAGIGAATATMARLAGERKAAASELHGELKRWRAHRILPEGRKRLELGK